MDISNVRKCAAPLLTNGKEHGRVSQSQTVAAEDTQTIHATGLHVLHTSFTMNDMPHMQKCSIQFHLKTFFPKSGNCSARLTHSDRLSFRPFYEKAVYTFQITLIKFFVLCFF
jgi:hypothetical protein